MNEREALRLLSEELPTAGDDAAVIDGLVITTDMLHESTDFPTGTTRYTAGWRGVGASLSDVAAMGAAATACVAVYGAPGFDAAELTDFIAGARDVSEAVGAEYVGGDLDTHVEFTVATTAIGETDAPVLRSGASTGDAVCVTGTLGRTAAALRLFDQGDVDRANELFRFEPRVATAKTVASEATAMIDSSDGLARSLHQLTEASQCGVSIESGSLPIDEAIDDVADDPTEALELGVFVGEDFELVFTVPPAAVAHLSDATPTPITVIGEVTESGVQMDGAPLEDRGYSHGQ